jgi:tetratricopeptide (TPR) repeat protein
MPGWYYWAVGAFLLLWLLLLPFMYRAMIAVYWGLRANRLVLEGSYRRAVEACDKGLRRFPRHAGLFYIRGVAQRRLRMTAEAMESYRHATECDPSHYRAHYNLGIMLREQGNLGDAERAFMRALVIKPEYMKAHCNLAILYDKMGNREKALEHYAKYFLCGGADPTVRARAKQLSSEIEAGQQDEQA